MRSLLDIYPELLIGTYYRRFVSGKKSPGTGGLIAYTNHTNGLIDGGMGLLLTKRPISILAKASLFKIPILSSIIRALGGIPIYRQKDNVDMSANDGAFRDIFEFLRNDGVLLIYPEGESRFGFQLRPFKTGAARMALGAEASCDLPMPIQLQPSLIIYEDQNRFLSRAHIRIGEPFDCKSYLQAYAEDERECVRALTLAMQAALGAMTMPVDDRSDFNLVVELDRLNATSPVGAPERWHALALKWTKLKSKLPNEAEPLQDAIQGFKHNLARLGLDAYDLKGPVLERTLGMRLQAIGGVLLGAVLSLIWFPPILLARVIAHFGRSTPDKLVTMIVVGSSVLMPIWGLFLAFQARSILGFWAGLGVLTATGLGWLWLVRRAGKPRPLRRACTFLGLQGNSQTVDNLWIEKQNLYQQWNRAVEALSLNGD